MSDWPPRDGASPLLDPAPRELNRTPLPLRESRAKKPPRPPHHMYMPLRLCRHCGGQRVPPLSRTGAGTCSECRQAWQPVAVLITNYDGHTLDAVEIAEEYRRWKWREDGGGSDVDGFGLGTTGSGIIPFGWAEWTRAEEAKREAARRVVPVLDAAVERVEAEGLHLAVRCPHCPGERGAGIRPVHRHVLIWQREWGRVSPVQQAHCELGSYKLRLR